MEDCRLTFYSVQRGLRGSLVTSYTSRFLGVVKSSWPAVSMGPCDAVFCFLLPDAECTTCREPLGGPSKTCRHLVIGGDVPCMPSSLPTTLPLACLNKVSTKPVWVGGHRRSSMVGSRWILVTTRCSVRFLWQSSPDKCCVCYREYGLIFSFITHIQVFHSVCELCLPLFPCCTRELYYEPCDPIVQCTEASGCCTLIVVWCTTMYGTIPVTGTPCTSTACTNLCLILAEAQIANIIPYDKGLVLLTFLIVDTTWV